MLSFEFFYTKYCTKNTIYQYELLGRFLENLNIQYILLPIIRKRQTSSEGSTPVPLINYIKTLVICEFKIVEGDKVTSHSLGLY